MAKVICFFIFSLAMHPVAGSETFRNRRLAPFPKSETLKASANTNRAQTIRRAVLCTLAVQNACQMLSMRYSRLPSQPKYLSSTAVVNAEIVKIIMSFIFLCSEMGLPAFQLIWQSVIVEWKDTLKVGVPAFLYLVQNNLLYVATTHLDAATCQVAYQLKLLTTAFFSVALLGRQISGRRWGALGLLFAGVILVQAPKPGRAVAAAAVGHNPFIGTCAVAGACLLSGLAGVYLEKIVKSTSDVPIWVRNIQLGFVSLIIGVASVQYLDGAAVARGGFFQGYTWVTALVVLQVSAGGLLVGLIMKYADNVIKGFATSLSIVISSGLSWFIPAFDFSPSLTFVAGSTLVIISTILYSSPAASQAQLKADLGAAKRAADGGHGSGDAKGTSDGRSLCTAV